MLREVELACRRQEELKKLNLPAANQRLVKRLGG
jgi:hypothetical protein